MTRGRPGLGAKIVDHLAGSRQAKTRLRMILRILAGETTISDACREPGIRQSRFHKLRNEAIQTGAAQTSSHPKNAGSPLAPEPQDALAFREYAQRVWSRAAGRPISMDEANRIIEDFGRFLRALAGREGNSP